MLTADWVVTVRQITPEMITSGLCLGKLRQTRSVARGSQDSHRVQLVATLRWT